MSYRGTIFPNAHFDDSRAAESLERIRTPYKVRYGKDLEEELRKHLKGDFEEVILSLMNTPTKEDVVQIHRAVKGLGTNERVLTEILCSRDKDELEAIRNVYFANYHRRLEDVIAGDTSGDYRRLLLALVMGSRDDARYADLHKAQLDAAVLAKPLEKKLIGGGGEKFEKYRILATHSWAQLRRTLQDYYYQKTGTTLDKAIERELSGDFGEAVMALYIVAAFGRPRYFAYVINQALKSKGSRDEDVIRVLVSRAEIDLEDVKEEYRILSGRHLSQVVSDEFKGAYKEALLALVRGNKVFTYN